MINPSIFTYYPPCTEEPEAFIGFSRYEKENQVTDGEWEKVVHCVWNTVVKVIATKYRLSYFSNHFTRDQTEIGIVLKKLGSPGVRPLSEIAIEHYDQEQIAKGRFSKEVCERARDNSIAHLYKKSINSSVSAFKPPHEVEISDFAVKRLSEMSLQYGVDKKRILEQVQKARNEGFLSPETLYHLQMTTLQS